MRAAPTDAEHHRAPDLRAAAATIGRAEELAALGTLLGQDGERLVTIVGPGGVGKTHLALRVANDLAPAFRDGVVIVSFAQVPPDAVWETIGTTLGISHTGQGAWHEAILTALARQRLLLVLDNCETVLDDLATLPALLEACPGVVALATSREPLRLREEREFWLQPLSLPDDEATSDLDVLRSVAAVQLFVGRAARARPGFALVDDNAEDVASIVRMLDGLPLAIELAAANLRHLSPIALRQRLAAALPTLQGGSRDLPARHQSLRGTVMWSLGLLSDDDRDAFLQISLFAGGVTPEAASAVLGSATDRHGWDLLLTFADKSLLDRVVDTDETRPRFLMLETVRAVALDLLRRDPGTFGTARSRHARFVVALAREAAENFHGPDQLAWLQRIDTEHANIAAVLEAALDDDAFIPDALSLAGPMFWYWYTRSYHAWALPLLERLLARAPAGTPATTLGPARVTAGWLAFRQSEVERADLHFSSARCLFPDMDTPSALLGRIGNAYVLAFNRTDMDCACAMLREVCERARTVAGAWHEEAAGHFGLGLMAYFDHLAPEARTSFERSIRLVRAHDDRQSIGMNLVYLAQCDRLSGDPASALWKLQEALPLLFAVGDRANIALALDVVIATLVALDEEALARRMVAVDEELRQTFGIPRPPLERPDYAEALQRLQGEHVTDDPPVTLNEALDMLLRYRPAPARDPSRDTAIGQPPVPASAVLSHRELEVLHLVAAGLTAAEIASRLYLSRHTVKRHMANIRQKLGVHSQAAAVAALQGHTPSGKP